MMDECLRLECQNLLDQLKRSQKSMKREIASQKMDQTFDTKYECTDDLIESFHLSQSEGKKANGQFAFGEDLTGYVNVSKDTETGQKVSYARSKLSSLSRTGESYGQKLFKKNDQKGENEKENFETDTGLLTKYSNKSTIKTLPSTLTRELSNKGDMNNSDNYTATSSSWQPATPTTQRRRQLIDRHIAVPTRLDEKELRSLNNERLLNYSYSHINVDDNITSLSSDPKSGARQSVADDISSQDSLLKMAKDYTKISSDQEMRDAFQKQLKDEGNNRKLNNFIKEASIKPKSILNSSAYYSLNSSKRNNSRVHFNTNHSFEEPTQDHRMLGYDWIAALLENDPHLNNQSESFFDDIKDFRKAYKDECSNQFYMESPYTLVDSEPEPVVEALTEPKVRPYVVNERLFTEPFRPDLIDYEEDSPQKKGSKEPTKDNPRFVRVSIPRSTLQTPYRVKPHRRGSFDAADSCALMDHCLLGWENSRPAMLPTAQSLDLNTEAGTRVDSETTTLAEAERLANLHSRAQWPFAKPTARQQTLPIWKKQYMNTTLNLSTPAELTQSVQYGSQPGDVKRVTDRLLSSTYSTMYEMERLRQERELDKKRNEEEEKRRK